jgi:hypothetical protein
MSFFVMIGMFDHFCEWPLLRVRLAEYGVFINAGQSSHDLWHGL